MYDTQKRAAEEEHKEREYKPPDDCATWEEP